MIKKIITVCVSLCVLIAARKESGAQPNRLSLQDCILIALQQNIELKTGSLKKERAESFRKTAFNPGKTNFSLEQDPTEGGSSGNAISVTQEFAWPGVYVKHGKMLQQQSILLDKEQKISRSEIIRAVSLQFYNYSCQKEKYKVLKYLDSIYMDFSRKANVRYRTGASSNLEALAAQNKLKENEIALLQTSSDMEQSLLALQELLNSKDSLMLAEDTLKPIPWSLRQDTITVEDNPELAYLQQNIDLSESKLRLAKSMLMPDITIGYSQQYLIKAFNPADIDRSYFPQTRIGGFQVGLSFPLFAGAYAAGIKAEKIEKAIAQNQLTAGRLRIQTEWKQTLKEYQQYAQTLRYYEESGLNLANEQIRVAQVALAKGAIGYVEFIQNLSQATETKLNYLTVLNQLNASVIRLQYLQGNAWIKE